MAKRTCPISFFLAALLVALFLAFSGCSESVNSPLSQSTSIGDGGGMELAGGKDKPYGGGRPDENWDDARGSGILETRYGELLSPADIKLEYDPDDFPPGVEPRVHFGNPHVYQFTVLPVGLVKNRHVRVTIDYSKANLTGVSEELLQIYGGEGSQYHASPHRG